MQSQLWELCRLAEISGCGIRGKSEEDQSAENQRKMKMVLEQNKFE